MSSDSVGDVSRHPIQRGPPRSIVGTGQAALDVHHARPRRLVGSNDGRVYGGSISPAARSSGNTKPSPVTSFPAVAKGKVVVATADGQVICFG
jgi:hypothetical protein